MLPGMDGFSVLRELRKSDRVPVLMLTARDKIEDRVKGLRDGADDYLVKPFALSELLARVLALGRRSGQNQGEAGGQNVLRVGDLELDLLRRRARARRPAGPDGQGIHAAGAADAQAG